MAGRRRHRARMACPRAPISFAEALQASALITFLYVASLYLPFNRGHRNSPQVIRRRLLTLSVLTVALEAYIRHRVPASQIIPLCKHAFAFLVATVLTVLLYAGHLAAVPLRSVMRFSLHDVEHRHEALRNYVLGPLFEELCFRRHTILMWSCHSWQHRVIISALLFALAHAHHGLSMSTSAVLLQFTFTFLFGIYAATLYENAASICAPYAAHVLCNVLELPNFDAIAHHARRNLILVLYALSLVAFGVLFAPLTALARPHSSASQ
ncbi:CAAX prenyl protease 2 [Gracilariopsis chorda]|uniref:intramembrane prenyl-peptidase Rce1 n=1 Tax=Gracilariopsis chorda TaxID=448386 RepID=A0A2V3IW25_9FLOR|nr:CAAX prenyl protease 2 [Gracilariopsis chorda]|eukprot:PXF45340.1 CAAX prenyl protease 2 [Gracilariopsis chorda]